MTEYTIQHEEPSVVADGAGPGAGDAVARFIEPWVRMTGQYPEHRIAFTGNLAVTLSNTNCAFLNMITLQGPSDSPGALREDIELAREHADACNGPVMMAACTAWLPPDGIELIASSGLEPAMSMVGMATDALAPPRREEAPLDWRRVEDEATGRDLGIVNAEAYGLDHAFMAVSSDVHRWSPRAFAMVGYEGNLAVTGALAMAFDEMIYIGWVATLPTHYGRGYGEAAMRRAIAAAEQASGPRRLWLHATEMGRPLYAAMGFETGAAMQMFNVT